MMVVRREVLSMLAGGVAAVAVNTRSLAASINGARSVTKQLPSFELQGTPTSLASLRTDVAAYSMVRGGSATFAVWLKCKDGRVLFMGVDQREPLPMFEVFTLAIATMDELKARWRDWKPPTLPDDMPEPFRTFVTARPAAISSRGHLISGRPRFCAELSSSWRTCQLAGRLAIIRTCSLRRVR